MNPPVAGDTCPPQRYTHSTVQLFRFSAVSWNSHRIHYDAEFAASEGFPGAVVQSTLHGETLTRYALAWAGPNSRLETASWRNRTTAVADEPLTWTATVRTVEGTRVSLEVAVLKADGTPCVTGTVHIALV
ncbi:MaoC/PaaZ C-terminal domain-containing protein [Streptomyces prunicolor]|uniref:MaoC/PaaZ C-terminal domain-containing protein n=1 Tax=Streptomyces prunicolor TaxID=67348 RepID=UPI00225AFA09|nr:MaoC/PaaZ C-terminal domain-containing protein [Streptomyces prunicolor]MCX5240607.1 MaoC/PaaZ C-terminal domain-containing protein [Streptomyces prunicolor]